MKRVRTRSLQSLAALSVALVSSAAVSTANAQTTGSDLRTYLQDHYPSLAYVERYRAAYPDDQTAAPPPWLSTSADVGTDPLAVLEALTALADQHVGLSGPAAGATETLGALFRTSSDGRMIVWRVFDENARALRVGDEVLSVGGRLTRDWLAFGAGRSFAGNPSSRRAEAAVNLALGSPLNHRLLDADGAVDLQVQSAGQAPRVARLAYQPMTEERAGALNAAVNRADLPAELRVGDARVGTIRIGAFAPQYDPVFNTAADAAETAAGSDEGDGPMLAGFCAVTRAFIDDYDAVAAKSDLMVLDLRGNLGGFAREARLLAWAMTGQAPPPTFDLFHSDTDGQVRLVAEPQDTGCGVVRNLRPILVLTDAGTRSSGEFMASWLWASGAVLTGQRTAGAGGGYEFGSHGVDIDGDGLNVRVSGNFSIVDPTGSLTEGETSESALLDQVGHDRFAPSRLHLYSFQAVGVMPDLPTPTDIDDLRDGGEASLRRTVAALPASAWRRR